MDGEARSGYNSPMLTFYFPDDRFPEGELTHVRHIARGIVLDEEGKIFLHKLHRNDLFGDQTYYETPGGGIDEGEDAITAFIRECDEEIGCKVEVIAPICHIRDFYRLIGRQNEQDYFLARKVGEGKIHHESAGDDVIETTLHVDIDTAIALMEGQSEESASGLVKQRELPVLYLAKKMMAKL